MRNDRRAGPPDDAHGAERVRRAEDELEQAHVALEDARAEAAALARERDAGAAELLRRTAQLREAEGRLRAREEAAAEAQAMLRAPQPGNPDEAEAETLRSALEEVQVLAEELGEANAALQRSNDELDRKVERRTAALAEANARLRAAEERQRLILESASGYAIFTMDASGRISSWNAGARDLLGWDAGEAIGMDSRAIFTPEDRAAGAPEEERRRASAEGRAADERWHVRRDGSRFWGEGLLMPLRGDGTSEGGEFLKVLRDRTERRRADERQALLVGELNHRVKNSLALVLAIVDQTWRATADSAGREAARGFHEALRARLRALARAHDLLVSDEWAGADLAEVVASATAPHGGAAARRAGGGPRAGDAAPADQPPVRASGPRVRLAPEASVGLAMAFHELATNAAKYGALSVPGGRVDVAWRVAADGDGLDLSWTERGGPPIEAPPSRRGFGSGLLERGLARQLGGEVSLEFARSGLRCRLRLPLSDRIALC